MMECTGGVMVRVLEGMEGKDKIRHSRESHERICGNDEEPSSE